jgi:hypothetical protein
MTVRKKIIVVLPLYFACASLIYISLTEPKIIEKQYIDVVETVELELNELKEIEKEIALERETKLEEERKEREAKLEEIRKKIALERERTESEIATLGLKKIKQAEVAKKVTSDLNSAIITCRRFNQLLPVCKQCSELEYLLILERAIAYSEEDIKKMMPFVKKEDVTMKDEIKKTEIEYEKRFKKNIPWYWVCSDEEYLKRLKKALETNTSYPEYDSSEVAYELGKAMAEYEMSFKRLSPEWHYSDKERLKYLKRSLEVDVPYLTKEEEAELEFKLRAEHEKKFGTFITDFELSTMSVYFLIGGAVGIHPNPRISVVKTPTGAIAKYLPLGNGSRNPEIRVAAKKPSEIKLDIGEWLDFVNALYKCHVNKWKYDGEIDEGTVWHLEIIFSDKDNIKLLSFTFYNEYPPNWDKFMKIMEGIVAKINKETGAKIKERKWWLP